jgi:hypothetical protein
VPRTQKKGGDDGTSGLFGRRTTLCMKDAGGRRFEEDWKKSTRGVSRPSKTGNQRLLFEHFVAQYVYHL